MNSNSPQTSRAIPQSNQLIKIGEKNKSVRVLGSHEDKQSFFDNQRQSQNNAERNAINQGGKEDKAEEHSKALDLNENKIPEGKKDPINQEGNEMLKMADEHRKELNLKEKLISEKELEIKLLHEEIKKNKEQLQIYIEDKTFATEDFTRLEKELHGTKEQLQKISNECERYKTLWEEAEKKDKKLLEEMTQKLKMENNKLRQENIEVRNSLSGQMERKTKEYDELRLKYDRAKVKIAQLDQERMEIENQRLQNREAFRLREERLLESIELAQNRVPPFGAHNPLPRFSPRNQINPLAAQHQIPPFNSHRQLPPFNAHDQLPPFDAHHQSAIIGRNLDLDNMSYEEILELQENIGYVNRGMDKKEINSHLPVNTYQSKKARNRDKEGDKIAEEDKCVICITEFNQGEKIRLLPCFHNFHVNCIDDWLKQSKKCPVCQIEV